MPTDRVRALTETFFLHRTYGLSVVHTQERQWYRARSQSNYSISPDVVARGSIEEKAPFDHHVPFLTWTETLDS